MGCNEAASDIFGLNENFLDCPLPVFICAECPPGQFHNFGVRNGTDFQDFGMKYKVGYTFSKDWYKVG